MAKASKPSVAPASPSTPEPEEASTAEPLMAPKWTDNGFIGAFRFPENTPVMFRADQVVLTEPEAARPDEDITRIILSNNHLIRIHGKFGRVAQMIDEVVGD